MNKFFYGAIVIILTIIIGILRSNNLIDVKTIKLLTPDVNIVGVIAPIAMILYTWQLGENSNSIIKGHPIYLEIFAYAIIIVIFLVALLLSFKKDIYTKYIAIQNVIVSLSFMIYMYFANTKSNIGYFLVEAVTVVMIGAILMMDCNMNPNNKDIGDYQSMLSLGSVVSVMLGFIQLPWISSSFKGKSIILIILISWILYFLVIRKANFKKNIKNTGMLMLILMTQLTIDMAVNEVVAVIIIVICLIQAFVCMTENTIDNWTTLLTLMIIASSIPKLFFWLLISMIITLIMMGVCLKSWFS